MEDKEVGELWLKRHECQNEYYSRQIGHLIRKLVVERANLAVQADLLDSEEAVQRALNDFGIDPETFK